MPVSIHAIVAVVQTALVFGSLGGALTLVVVGHRRPQTLPLAIAAGLLASALIAAAVGPLHPPRVVVIAIAVLAVVVAVVGGDPVTRRVLEIATHGRVRETVDGGIVMAATGEDGRPGVGEREVVLLRGGATIGYLERVATALAIVAGFPEALAVIVAVKGIGRFSELAASEARERFIIGTLSSLLWACAASAVVRLATG